VLYVLDATLGRMFQGLDALVGPDGYAVVLSSDHGIVPFPLPAHPPWCEKGAPNPYEKPCVPTARISASAVKTYLNDRLAARFGPDVVRTVVDALVYLSPAALGLAPKERAALDEALRTELRGMDAGGEHPVADVISIPPLTSPCPTPSDETLGALVCRTTSDRGDAYVVPRPGAFYWGKPGAREGSSHGSPYRYDRAVPLFVRYPKGARGQVVEKALFGSYYASTWYALTGESIEGPYGGVIGVDTGSSAPTR
jgi:arylsulfatase A-like enzyme